MYQTFLHKWISKPTCRKKPSLSTEEFAVDICEHYCTDLIQNEDSTVKFNILKKIKKLVTEIIVYSSTGIGSTVSTGILNHLKEQCYRDMCCSKLNCKVQNNIT